MMMSDPPRSNLTRNTPFCFSFFKCCGQMTFLFFCDFGCCANGLYVWFVRFRMLRLDQTPVAPSALCLGVGLRGTVIDAEPSLSTCHLLFRDARESRAKPNTKNNRRGARASLAKPNNDTAGATRERVANNKYNTRTLVWNFEYKES